MVAISTSADLRDVGVPDVQCDKCKKWVPQDTVKVRSGFTWCADCRQRFLEWVDGQIQDEEL